MPHSAAPTPNFFRNCRVSHLHPHPHPCFIANCPLRAHTHTHTCWILEAAPFINKILYYLLGKMLSCIYSSSKLTEILLLQLQSGPPLDEISIACILRDLLHAIEYLHNEGKIHRDIKGFLSPPYIFEYPYGRNIEKFLTFGL